jgi:hypothetical protein
MGTKHTSNESDPKRKTLLSAIKWTQLILLLLCVIAFLVAIILYASKINHNALHYTIDYTISTDSLGCVTNESRELADSIVSVIKYHDRMIEEKYQYFIEQQSNTQDLFTVGGIILGIIVSLVGFFGYSTMQSIEEKAKTIAGKAAKESFNEEFVTLKEFHNKEYLNGVVKPFVEKQFDDARNKYWNDVGSRLESTENDVSLLKNAVANIDKKIGKPQIIKDDNQKDELVQEPDFFNETK